MAKANIYGMVLLPVKIHKSIYSEIEELKKEAHRLEVKKNPAFGKQYSWGRFFMSLLRFAQEEGFFNDRETVKLMENNLVDEIDDIIGSLRR